MSMKWILIYIKFEIYINKDQFLKIIQKHKGKKKEKLTITGSAQ